MTFGLLVWGGEVGMGSITNGIEYGSVVEMD